MTTKVYYIISDIDKAQGFEWITENIDPARFELGFILLNERPSYIATYLREKGIPVFEILFRGKKQLPRVLWKVTGILRKQKPDVIHTHMYIADLVGLMAGKIAGVKKRVYTRHSSNESRKYHNKGRIDRVINALCTDVVAISENVRTILVEQESVPAKKVTLVHHGFDLNRFSEQSPAVIAELKRKYNPRNQYPVIGVVARYSHWKGIQHIITAFKELLQTYPGALLLLANAKKGDYKDELAKQLAELPADAYYEIEFEHNIFALYGLFDVYVHVPIDEELEAFGQTYVEALAAGVPSVFTLSGVAREFIVHEKNALVVGFNDPTAIRQAITRLLTDKALCERLILSGKQDIRELFSLDRMIGGLERLYASGNRHS